MELLFVDENETFETSGVTIANIDPCQQVVLSTSRSILRFSALARALFQSVTTWRSFVDRDAVELVKMR
jgi:hypothetical protein